MRNAFAPMKSTAETMGMTPPKPELGVFDDSGLNAFAPQAEPKQPATSGGAPSWASGNAFASDLKATQPKKPGMLQQAVGAFASGFAPKGYAEGVEMAQQKQQGDKDLVLGKIKATRQFLAQAAQMPAEQRGQFFATSRDAIMAQTGMDPMSGGAATYDDASLQAGIAQMDAMLGIAPEKAATPEPYTLAKDAVRYDAAGNIVADNRQPDPEKSNEMTPYQREQLRLSQERLEWDRTKPRTQGIKVGPDGTVTIGGYGEDGQQLTGPNGNEKSYYKDVGAYQAATAQRDTLLHNLEEAEKMVNGWTTGVGGAIMERIPGTPAVDLKQRIATVQALIGFDALQQMRQNSPTGGALGAITEKELAFLQSVQGSLATIQSEDQLKKVMGEVRASVQRLAAAQDAAFQYQYQALEPGAGRGQPRVAAGADVQVMPGLNEQESARFRELEKKFGGQR